MTTHPRPRIGISGCLIGEEVRFDGQHKRSRLVTDELGAYMDWVSVCPEVEVGMGIPRETIRLEGSVDAPMLIAPKSGRDWTAEMNTFAAERVADLATANLDGFILKKGSPSCGAFRVRRYGHKAAADTHHPPEMDGRGLFAAALIKAMPHLPVEEEGRLTDPALRTTWLTRVFAHRRWREFLRAQPGPGDLVSFHTAHKYSLAAHDEQRYRALGRLVATAGSGPFPEVLADYADGFFAALTVPATRGKHTNVLQHLAGFLKDKIAADDRAELAETIHDYREALLPWAAPMTLLRHHFRSHPDPWIAAQVYMQPTPAELSLRTHA